MTDMTSTTTEPARHAAPPNTPMCPLQVLLEHTGLPFLTIRMSTLLADAVVLGRHGLTADLLLGDGTLHSAYVGDHAQLIDDPVRQADLLRAAVQVLHSQAVQAGVDQRTQAERQRVVLDEIRAYVIRKHRQEDICRDGLDRFLAHFKMAPYQPQGESHLHHHRLVPGQPGERGPSPVRRRGLSAPGSLATR
jgi:hypothetical protein